MPCFYVFVLTVDQIYHLASPASPPNYMYNPIKTLKTNTIGTLNMLGECTQSQLLSQDLNLNLNWIFFIYFFIFFGDFFQTPVCVPRSGQACGGQTAAGFYFRGLWG